MFRILTLVVFLSLPVVVQADSPLGHVRHARALLGADIWSRIVRIENHGQSSVYPRTVYALVFEFSGLLWFYTDSNGTQSLSLHEDDLPAEKANLGALFRAIDRGFTGFELLVGKERQAEFTYGQALPNGCFIESFAALRARINRGEFIKNARLLSFYARLGQLPKGHTVLVYETAQGLFLHDPLIPTKTREVTREMRDRGIDLAGDPLTLARAINPELPLIEARWVPTQMPRSRGLMAGVTIALSAQFPADAKRWALIQ